MAEPKVNWFDQFSKVIGTATDVAGNVNRFLDDLKGEADPSPVAIPRVELTEEQSKPAQAGGGSPILAGIGLDSPWVLPALALIVIVVLLR